MERSLDTYLPAKQPSHMELPAAAKVPFVQGKQSREELLPITVLAWPTEHRAHADRPMDAAKVPAEHSAQNEAAEMAFAVPSGQY